MRTKKSLLFNGHFSGEPGLAGFTAGAKDDGSDGGNWIYKTCKAPVKLSPPTNQHPIFYRPDAFPVAQPTVSELRTKNESCKNTTIHGVEN